MNNEAGLHTNFGRALTILYGSSPIHSKQTRDIHQFMSFRRFLPPQKTVARINQQKKAYCISSITQLSEK